MSIPNYHSQAKYQYYGNKEYKDSWERIFNKKKKTKGRKKTKTKKP